MDYMQEVQGAEEVSGMKTHKVLWFIFFGIIFFVIFLVVYSIFNGGNKNISNNKLIEGVAVEVGENDVIKFNLGEEKHGMIINFIGDGSVELIISSEPINLSLKINEIKEIDLNNDGVFDLKIKLVSIMDRKATIAFQKIEKGSCKEDWECSGWLDCSKGYQKRKCEDLNSCGTIFDKPSGIKECLEIEFIEDNNAFENTANNSMNKSFNNSFVNLTNKTNIIPTSNLTNTTSNIINTSIIGDNISNVTNTTVEDNLIDILDTSVCPIGTYACYEPQGFFCKDYYDYNVFNPFCCPKECLKFDSEEQLCSARGYLYFTGNETHICKVQVYSPFNGANIFCCISIEIKRDMDMMLSTRT